MENLYGDIVSDLTSGLIGGESSTMAYTSAIIHEVKRIMEKVA